MENWGTTNAGATVHCHELRTESSFPVAVTIADLGAAVTSIRMPDRHGEIGEVTLGCGSAAQLEVDPFYMGVTVGRYANRIANAQFPLDGRVVELQANEGANQLHSGPDGFHRQHWKVAHADPQRLQLEHVNPDGSGGFPGELACTVSFELADREHAADLRISLHAKTSAPTPVNLTNHLYFCLGGPGRTVDDHLLHMPSDLYLPVNDMGIPINGPASVDGSPFDLRGSAPLGDRVIDHTLFLSPNAVGLDTADPVCLTHPASGRRVSVRTTKPAMQVYTGDYLRTPWRPRGGVALEPQFAPDSPNRPDFPSVVLRPGETYHHQTVITLESLPGESR